jgi:hypothetical protein
MAKKKIFLVRERAYRINVSGLIPNTVHYMYFERVLVPSGNLKPVGGKRGDTILTDENGQASFDFFYVSNITGIQSSLQQLQKDASLIAGRKEIVIANRNAATLTDGFDLTFSSFVVSKIVVQANG